MKNNITPILLTVTLIVLLVFLSDPLMLWMPPVIAMIALLVVVVVMIVWAGFILKEHSGDEREMIHRMNAGRVAYLSGLAVLTIALIKQGLSHHIDPWIALSLAVMVVSKLVVRIYLERYR